MGQRKEKNREKKKWGSLTGKGIKQSLPHELRNSDIIPKPVNSTGYANPTQEVHVHATKCSTLPQKMAR